MTIADPRAPNQDHLDKHRLHTKLNKGAPLASKEKRKKQKKNEKSVVCSNRRKQKDLMRNVT